MRSRHNGTIGVNANERPIGVRSLGKKVVLTLDNQNHAVAVRVIEILINYRQFTIMPRFAATFRIAYRASMEIPRFPSFTPLI